MPIEGSDVPFGCVSSFRRLPLSKRSVTLRPKERRSASLHPNYDDARRECSLRRQFFSTMRRFV